METPRVIKLTNKLHPSSPGTPLFQSRHSESKINLTGQPVDETMKLKFAVYLRSQQRIKTANKN
jgi:hypothetical protein